MMFQTESHQPTRHLLRHTDERGSTHPPQPRVIDMNPIAHRHRVRFGGTVLTVIALVASACSATPGASGTTAATGVPPSAVTATSPAPSSVAVESVAPTSVAPTPKVVARIPMEAALKPVWQYTSGSNSDPWIWEPAVDPKGRVWAASSFADEFWIISKDGARLGQWGTSGSEPGEFTFVVQGNGFGAITFRPDGGFYVADSGNNRVQQFDANRKPIRTWGGFGTDDGQLISPLDIGRDDQGRVYVESDSRHDIQVFDADGTFIRVAATDVGPYLAVAADGTLYAVQDDPVPSLQIYAPDGRWMETWDLHELMTFATAVAVTDDGRIFVASSTSGGASPVYENLLQLDSHGEAQHLWPSGAEGIAVNAAGDRLYATYSDITTVVGAFPLPKP
jgi:sugar lactone lactonase YvrE